MKWPTPNLTSNLDFSLTKKRFEMMGKSSSLLTKLFRSLPLIPFVLIISFVFCNKPTSMIPDSLYEDVKLHYKDLPVDYGKKLNREPILDMSNTPFTGTQSFYFKTNDRLHSVQTFEEGYITERTYFDEDGNQIIRYQFEYENGHQILFLQLDKNNNIVQEIKSVILINDDDDNILFSTNKEWHPNGQLKFHHSYYQTSLKAMVYDGLMTLYDEQGNILQQELYKDDKLVEKIK